MPIEPLLLTPRGLWDVPPNHYPLGVWLEQQEDSSFVFRFRIRSSQGDTSRIDACRPPLSLLVCRNQLTAPFIPIEDQERIRFLIQVQAIRRSLAERDENLLVQAAQSLWRLEWHRLPADPVRDGLLARWNGHGLRAARCTEEGLQGWAADEDVPQLRRLLTAEGFTVEVYP